MAAAASSSSVMSRPDLWRRAEGGRGRDSKERKRGERERERERERGRVKESAGSLGAHRPRWDPFVKHLCCAVQS